MLLLATGARPGRDRMGRVVPGRAGMGRANLAVVVPDRA